MTIRSAGTPGGVCNDLAWPPADTACVADAMVRAPKLCGADTTVGGIRALFADDHVHAALVVSGPTLLAVVERGDLHPALPPGLPAADAGTLQGRVVAPSAPLRATHDAMVRAGRRRLAVTDAAGALLGLLCLKRTGLGFCSDGDVQARAVERAAPPAAVRSTTPQAR